MSTLKDVLVPDIGDFKDVEIIDILVKPGDSIQPEDPLITLESDKATMDVPSPEAGIVQELTVKVGDKVSEGSLVLKLIPANESAEAPAAPEAPSAAAPAAPEPVASSGGVQEVRVPDIGDFKDVEIIEVLTNPGDSIATDAGLITLESDKATMEVPSPLAGVVKEMKVQVGDKVSEGDLIALVEVTGAPAAAPAPQAAPTPPAPAAPAPAAPAPSQLSEDMAMESPLRPPPVSEPVNDQSFRKAHASPSVRLFARELGVDLSKVSGTGRKGRITKEDVQNYVKQALQQTAQPAAAASGGMGIPAMPEVDFSKFGPVEVKPLSRIKKISGKHLHRAWLNVPMVTHHDEADITELEAFRKSLKDEAAKKGVKVTPLAFMLKACAATLQAHPNFNASLTPDAESLVYKQYVHIGVAVDTPDGLVVPVIRDVDQKGVYDLAAELGEVSARARDGKLKPQEMQGGCFSISSLGGIGGTAFTPLVNAPEVAILGITKSRMAPVWNGQEFVPRLMLPLDLTYDHRVIDGAQAARFMVDLCKTLGDLRRLLL